MATSPKRSVAALLDMADALVAIDPDTAREILAEACEAAAAAGDDVGYGRACELMGRVAFQTGDEDLMFAPLRQAFAAFDAAGDDFAAARVEGLLQGLTSARAPDDDDGLLRNELSLLRDAAARLEPAGPPAAGASIEPDPAFLARRAWLQVQRVRPLPATGKVSSLGELAQCFGLSELEIALLVASLAEHFPPHQPLGPDLLAVVGPTFWPRPDRDPAHRTAVGPEGRLMRFGLMTEAGADPDVVRFLRGARTPAASLAPFLERPIPGDVPADGPLAARWPEVLQAVRLGAEVHVCGGRDAERMGLAARLAADLGKSLFHLDAARAGEAFEHVVHLAARDARLLGALLSTDAPAPVPSVTLYLGAARPEMTRGDSEVVVLDLGPEAPASAP